MNAIDNYLHQKNLLEKFQQWSALIGKPYSGGVGLGQGYEIGSVCKATGTLTIYHQAYSGAKNYHDLDSQYLPYLEVAMKKHANLLIQSMTEELNKEVEKAKQAGLALAQELIKE